MKKIKSEFEFVSITKKSDGKDGLLYRYEPYLVPPLQIIFDSPEDAEMWFFQTENEKDLPQLISDLLVTAFEGGSNYWIERVEVVGDFKGYASDQISKGKTLIIHYEEGEKMELTHVKMVKGITKFLRHNHSTIEDLMNDHDAGDADVVLQFALFNEIVYG